MPIRLTNKCESNGRALANSWHYHDKDECYQVKTKDDVNVKELVSGGSSMEAEERPCITMLCPLGFSSVIALVLFV